MQVDTYKAVALFSNQIKAVIPEQMYMTLLKNLESVYSPQKLSLCTKISESPIQKTNETKYSDVPMLSNNAYIQLMQIYGLTLPTKLL